MTVGGRVVKDITGTWLTETTNQSSLGLPETEEKKSGNLYEPDLGPLPIPF